MEQGMRARERREQELEEELRARGMPTSSSSSSSDDGGSEASEQGDDDGNGELAARLAAP